LVGFGGSGINSERPRILKMGWQQFFGAIFILAMAAGSAMAAEIELIDLPGEVHFVTIKGEISEGDSDWFYEVIQNQLKITVFPESPGGLIKQAPQIGAEIRSRNFATLVAAGDECFSACGLI
jgi:hypothetical protein